QRDLHGHCDVAALASAASHPAPAEQRVPAEEGVEDVRERPKALERRVEAAGLQAVVTVAVVHRTALGVREHLVGLGGLLELLLGVRVVLVDVGMELAGEPAERALDVPLAGLP